MRSCRNTKYNRENSKERNRYSDFFSDIFFRGSRTAAQRIAKGGCDGAASFGRLFVVAAATAKATEFLMEIFFSRDWRELLLLPQYSQGLHREDPEKNDFKLNCPLVLLPLNAKDVFEELLLHDLGVGEKMSARIIYWGYI